jgi:murein DD-endopeptidase MepM/ murein hydrolase activator NlpD
MTHIQTLDVSISLWAIDRAGNKNRSKFWCRTSPGRFRSRRINITDRFINKVAPEILSKTSEIQEQPTLLETFLEINRTLRVKNNQKIAEMTQVSQPEFLWDEPFLQLSNSSVEANFADFRRYYYQNKPIDEQTHLGFDLASTAQSPVEASNRGKVVFAQYLGIYGNTVIVDHGLGLFSLYGHLSSIGVQPDEIVERGQSLGRTGQSGLAGGDHLHFSMILQGTQVNPIEWWDRNWIQNRILQKYRGF